jgi:Protein of unknown function (DUF998)
MNTLAPTFIANPLQNLAAWLALASIGVSLLALIGLHFLSPEYAPSWRMVSEYANGQHAWVLIVVFLGWALGSFALLTALWPIGTVSSLAKVGLVFLALAGIGQVMGAVFDINHKMHGPAAMIGIPSLCIAAVLLNMVLDKSNPSLAPAIWASHLPWISFTLMLIGFALFFSALKASGIDVSAQTEPLKALPEGVSSFVGWANRLIFLSSYLWVSWAAIKIIRAAA